MRLCYRVAVVSADARLRVDIGSIIDRPGASTTLHERLVVPGSSSSPEAAIEIEVNLDSMIEGIGVHGTIRGTAAGQCTRCLEPIDVPVDLELREVYLAAGAETEDGEAYEVDGTEVDLEPLIRDVLSLELPAYPRCREDCAGLCPSCGVDRNTTDCSCTITSIDPRLAALADLDTRKD